MNREMNMFKRKHKCFRVRCIIKGKVRHYYDVPRNSKYSINNKTRFHVKKKNMYNVVNTLRNVKNWVFINEDMFHMEIDSPTLEHLIFYKEIGMFYVIKGFNNPIECRRIYRLNKRMMFNTLSCITSLTSPEFMMQSLINFFQGEELPSDDEIHNEIEENRLVPITDDSSIKLLKKREKTQGNFISYRNILHRLLMKMKLFGRLHKLEVMLKDRNI